MVGDGGDADSILFTAEGVEMVHLCFWGSQAPTEMVNAKGGSYFLAETLYQFVVARPSGLSQPTITPITEWYGESVCTLV